MRTVQVNMVTSRPLLPKVLPGMESELLRPFRAFLLRGFGSQGVALGYDIAPFQGLMLVWRDTHG